MIKSLQYYLLTYSRLIAINQTLHIAESERQRTGKCVLPFLTSYIFYLSQFFEKWTKTCWWNWIVMLRSAFKTLLKSLSLTILISLMSVADLFTVMLWRGWSYRIWPVGGATVDTAVKMVFKAQRCFGETKTFSQQWVQITTCVVSVRTKGKWIGCGI